MAEVITVRRKIVNRLVTEMEAVPNVRTAKRWKTFFDESEMPAISVADTTEDEELFGGVMDAPNETRTMNVSLRIFVQDADDAADSLDVLMAGVRAKLKTIQDMTDVGVQIRGIRPAGNALHARDPQNQNFDIGGAEVAVQIIYITKTFED